MTNFEKWKQGLMPDDLININGVMITCNRCPADCPRKGLASYTFPDGVPPICANIFRVWAESEAIE
jgi:hypothetical protein